MKSLKDSYKANLLYLLQTQETHHKRLLLKLLVPTKEIIARDLFSLQKQSITMISHTNTAEIYRKHQFEQQQTLSLH